MNLFTYTLINNSVERQWFSIILKRFKSKKSSKFIETGPHIKALNHFDDFYKAVFGEKWPSVRLGLLSKQKYIAVINNFGEIKKTEKLLESLGSFNLRSFFEVQKNCINDFSKENVVNKNNPELDEILLDKLKEEEDKESHLRHPEGVEFSTKVQDFNEINRESENDNESIYSAREALSSLTSDMKKAEMDEERIIMPESATKLEILSNFIPATKLRGVEHFIPESEYYKYYKVKSESSILVEEELELDFPENLNVYSFDRGEILDFPDPTRCINCVYNYLKVDGADLLASLVLGVQPSDMVLDLCSTSSNISFCLFQTLRPKLLICTNDKINNTSDLFNDYLFESSAHWNEMLLVTSSTVDENKNSSMFDKVLVDVPSTFDKTSLFIQEDNPFHVKKLKSRLQLPEYQKLLLVKGLRLVRPGGAVLYTTSTLSPIQNDGVVYEALRTAWNDHKIECTVKNLSPALRHTSLLFNYGNYLNLKFGTLVVPFVPSNFGPRYMCKIIRNEQKEAENSSDEVKPEEFL